MLTTVTVLVTRPPTPTTLTSVDATSVPILPVKLTPVGEITPVPVTVKEPKLLVIAFPEGKAVLPIATDTVPVSASISGSLAATTVNVESPDIENVPIDAVKGSVPASANPPTCPTVAVVPSPVGTILKSVVPTA